MNAVTTRRWVLLVAVFAGCAVAFALSRGPRGARGEMVLPDGRSVSVAKVTFGTTHDLEGGSIFARLAARVAGPQFAARLGYVNYSQKSAAPCVMVWTRWYGDVTNTPPRHASVRDDSGMETEPIFPSWDSSAVASTERLMAWRFENYPRGAKEFEIRFHDRLPPYHTNPLGALKVRNPQLTNATPYGAAGIPQSVSTDGITVTLKELRVGAAMPFWRRPSHSGLTPWTQTRFDVVDHGLLSTNWAIRGVSLLGASGNLITPMPLMSRIQDGQIEAGFTAAWWRFEPDWKFEVVLGRTAAFLTNEIFHVLDMPASGLDTALVTNCPPNEAALPGMTLTLHPASPEAAGGGGFVHTTTLLVRYPVVGRSARLVLARVRDQLGRPVRFESASDNGLGRLYAGLMLAPETTRLNFTFGVSHSRTVTFVVRTPVVQGVP